jgi:site-specific DNA-methyltransferase (adenine-specific)
MKPYFQDESVTIYLGDCRDILPSLPKVDLVLTDFPYGNGTEYESYLDSQANLERLITDTWYQILRVADVALIFCGVANINLYPKPTWILCWAIEGGAGVGSSSWGFASWQPILAYGSDPYLRAGKGRRPDTITTRGFSSPNEHPCPKPEPIMRWLITRATLSADKTILDPFMGSGTTLRAAKDLDRKAIGIEIEEKYCEIAAKRMSQSVLGLTTEADCLNSDTEAQQITLV